jgi:hypothetical protein
MIRVFWKRDSRPLQRHQCRLLTLHLFFCVLITYPKSMSPTTCHQWVLPIITWIRSVYRALALSTLVRFEMLTFERAQMLIRSARSRPLAPLPRFRRAHFPLFPVPVFLRFPTSVIFASLTIRIFFNFRFRLIFPPYKYIVCQTCKNPFSCYGSTFDCLVVNSKSAMLNCFEPKSQVFISWSGVAKGQYSSRIWCDQSGILRVKFLVLLRSLLGPIHDQGRWVRSGKKKVHPSTSCPKQTHIKNHFTVSVRR